MSFLFDTDAISEVLRSRMYAMDYGEPEIGRASYAAIGTNASACTTCSHQSCLGSCPYGLPIPELTKATEAAIGRG